MTRISPSLRIQRFVVRKGGGELYDENFNVGLNIIRGDNSVGKSTIAELMFYALGGDLP